MLSPEDIAQLVTIKPKLEAALASYLRTAAQDPSSPLFGTYIAESQSQTKRTLPAMVLFAEEDEELSPGDEDYEIRLWIYVLTQRDDETAVMHDRRLGEARRLLANFPALKLALNIPGGDDTRPVKGFHLIGLQEDRPRANEAREAERKFGEHLRYKVFAANYDVRR